MPHASTIDDVITDLDQIIEECRAAHSRLGYFPALYRKVTLEVKKGIQAGQFEDGPRMEMLDVIFANRYIEAYKSYRNSRPLTRSWLLAFEAGESSEPIVLQHLLLGMNAHINLDLGIAAAQTSPGTNLAALHSDFNQINRVLASLVDGVRSELSHIWPPLRVLAHLTDRQEDRVINFSMTKARDHAWGIAEKLARLPAGEHPREIAQRDQWTAAFGQILWKPPPLTRLLNRLIRLGERRSILETIEILM
jgi:hypothetical protein